MSLSIREIGLALPKIVEEQLPLGDVIGNIENNRCAGSAEYWPKFPFYMKQGG